MRWSGWIVSLFLLLAVIVAAVASHHNVRQLAAKEAAKFAAERANAVNALEVLERGLPQIERKIAAERVQQAKLEGERTALGTQKAELTAEIAQLGKQIEELTSVRDQNKSKHRESSQDISRMSGQIAQLTREIAALKEMITTVADPLTVGGAAGGASQPPGTTDHR